MTQENLILKAYRLHSGKLAEADPLSRVYSMLSEVFTEEPAKLDTVTCSVGPWQRQLSFTLSDKGRAEMYFEGGSVHVTFFPTARPSVHLRALTLTSACDRIGRFLAAGHPGD
jgi:hypothetical protein